MKDFQEEMAALHLEMTGRPRLSLILATEPDPKCIFGRMPEDVRGTLMNVCFVTQTKLTPTSKSKCSLSH